MKMKMCSGIKSTPLSFIWITLIIIGILLKYAGGEEYCITERFQPTCHRENGVILIDHAQYGRMKLGRCVTRDFGENGCSQDVLNMMDNICSGRKSCDVSISDPALVRTQPCSMEFASYLEIEYSCVDVIQIPRDACKLDGHHINTQSQGYLSPLTSKHVRHEKRCPVVIHGEPGQRIAFTLFDFTFRNESTTKGADQYCQPYLSIRELSLGSDVTICSSNVRERQVYVSRTHEAIVDVVPKTDGVLFLLKFEVTGCPKLKLPEGTYAKYDDDVVSVSCNNSRESFTLRCVNTTWFGELRNCSTPVANTRDAEGDGSLISLPPLGISIIIILGVAMVIVVYVAVMIVCVLYIKKRRRRAVIQENDSSDIMTADANRMKMGEKEREERLPMLSKTTIVCTTNSSDCGEMCELHEMKPCTVCNNCATYVSTKSLGREECPYGRGPIILKTPQGTTMSPGRFPIQTVPGGFRPQGVPNGPASPARQMQCPTNRGQIRPLSVDSKLYAEGPYGFPTTYFKTFAKSASNPAAAGGSDQMTSPDIVPECCDQNSVNTALDVSTVSKATKTNTGPGHKEDGRS